MGPVPIIEKVEGLEELRARLRAIPAELDQQQRVVMHRAVILLTEDAQGRVHSPQGRARAGIKWTITGSGDRLKGTVKARSKAAKHSIRGRRPGKMPRVGTVRRFMARAGRPVSRSAAFLIARAIGRRGMVGHPVMEATLEAKRTHILSLWMETIGRALRRRGGR